MYQLMNKDKVILEFDILKIPPGWVAANVKVRAEKLPPDLEVKNLVDWLTNRRAPYNREHIKQLLELAGIASLKGYLDLTMSLSLNDSLWVRPGGSTLTFAEVNLFDNSFSEVVSHFAFTGELHGAKFDTTSYLLSPEFSTNGMLAKRWHREKNGIVVLQKAGTSGLSNTGRESYAEWLATQLLTALDFYHVKYTLAKVNGALVSVCPLFTTKDLGYTPVYKFVDNPNFMAIVDYYKESGWSNELSELTVLDALIGNTDRHVNNFGAITSNETYEVLEAAPIFDNGFGLFSLGSFDSLEEAVRSEYLRRPCLYDDFVEVAHAYLTPQTRKALINLRGFKFMNHPKYPMEQKRLDILTEVITYQASRILIG